jgi:cyclophilin family peptidyl-prolyl cis-trans isomerase
MPTRGSGRDRERRAARDEAQRRQAARAQRRRQIIAIGAVMLVLLLVGGAIAAATSSNNSSGTATSTTTTAAASSTTATDGPTVTTPPGPAGAALTGATPCPAEDGSSARTTQFAQPPPTCIDPAKSYDAVVTTSEGSFTFYLNTKLAPTSVNNFVVLARYHYYDGTPVTEITTDTTMQAGSVTNSNGSPGPGYTLPAEYQQSGSTTGVVITLGTLALAPISTTNDAVGAQFLITLGDKAASLAPTTTVIGLMLDDPGNTVHKINTLGTQSGGPTKVVTIQSVKIVLAPVTSTTATP